MLLLSIDESFSAQVPTSRRDVPCHTFVYIRFLSGTNRIKSRRRDRFRGLSMAVRSSRRPVGDAMVPTPTVLNTRRETTSAIFLLFGPAKQTFSVLTCGPSLVSGHSQPTCKSYLSQRVSVRMFCCCCCRLYLTR